MGLALQSRASVMRRNGATPFSIMRRRRVRSLAAPTRALRFPELVRKPRHLAVERLDLLPLRGQGFAEILGDTLLMRAGDLQRLDTGAQTFGFVHGSTPVSVLGCDAGDHIAPAAKI